MTSVNIKQSNVPSISIADDDLKVFMSGYKDCFVIICQRCDGFLFATTLLKSIVYENFSEIKLMLDNGNVPIFSNLKKLDDIPICSCE